MKEEYKREFYRLLKKSSVKLPVEKFDIITTKWPKVSLIQLDLLFVRNLRKTSKTFEKLRSPKFQLCFTFSNNSFGREKNIVYFMRTLENTLDGATVLLLLPSSDKSLQKRAGSPNPFSALFLL